jgi:peroxiredoxin
MIRHSKYTILVLVLSTLQATCGPKPKPLFSKGVENCQKGGKGVVTNECWERYLISESKTNPVILDRCEANLSLAEFYAGLERNQEADNIYQALIADKNCPECISRAQTSYQAFKEVRIGLKAPEFLGRDTQGNSISLASLRGRTVLLLFWSSGCGACKYAYEDLKILQKARSGEISIIGISGDLSRSDFDSTIAKYGLTWPNILDGNDFLGPISKLYSIDRYPSIFVINEKGIINSHSYRALLPKKS